MINISKRNRSERRQHARCSASIICNGTYSVSAENSALCHDELAGLHEDSSSGAIRIQCIREVCHCSECCAAARAHGRLD